jgi:hypothetical protein
MHVLNKDRGFFLRNVFRLWVLLSLFGNSIFSQPTIIFQEDFNGGLPTGWQITEGDPIGATWQWSATGKADSALVDDEPISAIFWNNRPSIQSPSAANGVMMFNSDAYDSAGIGIGDGPFPGNQSGHLISPIINCQFHPIVYLKFHHYARALRNHPSTRVSISTDNGESWVDVPLYHPVTESQSTMPSAMELIDISAIAGGAPNVRLRFSWVGRYYFWLLDDVELITAPDVELSLTSANYPPTSFAKPYSFISADTFRFSAGISNLGQLETDSITLKISLFEVLGPLETILYSDSIVINALPAFCLDSLIQVPNFFLPVLPEGDYRLSYEVEVLHLTEFSYFNNKKNFPFRVTSDEFAKEDDIDVGLRPEEGGDYEVGNIYKLSGSEFDLYKVDEVTFSAAKEETDGSLDGENVVISLYEISEDVLPDFSNFQTTNYNDLTLLGVTNFTFPEMSQDFQFFHTPLLSILGDDLTLCGGKRYLLSARYEDSASSIFHSFNDDIDYNRTSTIVYRNGWFTEGFGTERAAVLRLDLSILSPNSTHSEEAISWSVFPNPANDLVQIKASQTIENANLVITNSKGQIVSKHFIGSFLKGDNMK